MRSVAEAALLQGRLAVAEASPELKPGPGSNPKPSQPMRTVVEASPDPQPGPGSNPKPSRPMRTVAEAALLQGRLAREEAVSMQLQLTSPKSASPIARGGTYKLASKPPGSRLSLSKKS